jgi:hypothetical protein
MGEITVPAPPDYDFKIKLPCLEVGYCYFESVVLKSCSDFQCPEYDNFEITNVHGSPIKTCDAIYKDVIRSCTIDRSVASLTCNAEKQEYEKSILYNENCPGVTEYSCWKDVGTKQIPALTCELSVLSGGSKTDVNFLLIAVVIVLTIFRSY